MNTYLQPLLGEMDAAADAQNARAMAAYMRDQFSFLGIKSPERREILKRFLAAHGTPDVAEVGAVAVTLWELPEREHQYNALDILRKVEKTLPPEFLPTLEWLITTKSWWDTVDGLAANTAGTLFARFPDIGATAVSGWRYRENIWLRRTTLLFQLRYKDQTDVPLLFSLIEQNREDDEFFIQKAIGWALREYSKRNATAVRDFVARADLSPLAQREALKWLARQEARSNQKGS